MAGFLLEIMPMSSRLVHGLLIVIAFILTVHFLRETSSVVLPFFTAAVLSFFAQPLVSMMTRHRIPHGAAIAVVIFAILLVLVALGVLVHIAIAGFVEKASEYQHKLVHLWRDVLDAIGVSPSEAAQGIGSQVKEKGTTAAAGVLGGVVGSAFALAEGIVLAIVYLLFFLWGRRSLPALLERAFGPDKRRQTMAILCDVEHQSLRYIGLRTILCVVTGFVAWLILQLFGVEFAVLFGVINFVAQYVPFVGPVAASIAPILIALIQFDDPLKALWVGVCLTIWHLFVGYFVEPRAFGRGMHLSQPLLLLGLLFFAWLWGAAGAILAVPLLVVAKSIFDNVRPLRPAGVILGGDAS
jgi:predicted PurR-regulated permease PerM